MAEKQAAKPAAKAAAKKNVKSRGKLYDGGKAKNKSCPKCGQGYFLAEHKDRRVCGKCKYVESKK